MLGTRAYSSTDSSKSSSREASSSSSASTNCSMMAALTGCFLLLELERFKINIAAVDRNIERSAAVKELLLILCGDQLFLLCRQLVVSVQRLLHLLAMLFLHTLGRRKLLDELFDCLCCILVFDCLCKCLFAVCKLGNHFCAVIRVLLCVLVQLGRKPFWLPR